MVRQLRIAILPPLKRPITPETTVSRNRIIADLSLGLTAIGHKVTMFGTNDSHLPGVEVVGVIEKGLNSLPPAENPFYQHTASITQVISEFIKRQDNFDLAHNHMYPEFLPLLSLSSIKIPMITTVHAQMTPELKGALFCFPQATLVTPLIKVPSCF